MTHTVVLSPHYDDAALGAFTVLSRHESVTVVTIFGGAPQDDADPGAVTREFLAECGLPPDPQAANAIRRAEDRAALELAGVRFRQLTHPEALYRRGPDGLPSIRYESDLFTSSSGDSDLIATLEQSVAAELESTRTVVIPLANGHHVDHRLARTVGENLASQMGLTVIWYVEPTYGTGPDGIPTGLRPRASGRQVRILDDDLVRRKRRVVAMYRSQLRMFGVDEQFWERLRSEAFFVEAGSDDRVV